MNVLSRTVGVDLASTNDWFVALVLDEVDGPPQEGVRFPDPLFQVRHIHRRRGIPYPAVADDLYAMSTWPALRRSTFVVDGTGVGRAVVDALRQRVSRIHSVVITGGQEATSPSPHESHTPKVDLIGAVSLLMQQGRLAIDESLPDAGALRQELAGFGYSISESGRMTMAATGGGHDDLVLALSLACWWATRPSQGKAWKQAWMSLVAPGALPGHKPEGPRR